MTRFRTKPFEIEAVQFTGDNEAEIQAFTGEDKFRAVTDGSSGDDILAQVLDVLHSTWVGVRVNQWIIKGNKGEFYPCDPEIFAAKYEEIESSTARNMVEPNRIVEPPRPTMESSADAIRRGADWVSDTGGTVTSKNTIDRNPQQGGRFRNR